MPYKDPEAKKQWRRRNSKEISAYTAQWKAENPERAAEHRERQSAKQKEATRVKRALSPLKTERPDYSRRHRQRLRAHGIGLLGGACCRCGLSDERVLQFDHKVPVLRGTNGLRRGDTTREIAKHIRDGSFRDVFQLLCANCHVIKTREEGSQLMGDSRPLAMRIDDPTPRPRVAPPAPLPLFDSVGPWSH